MAIGKQLRFNFDSDENMPDNVAGQSSPFVVLSGKNAPEDSLNAVSLDVLGLSKRSYNALMRRGLGTLGDVVAVLEEYDHLGRITVRNLGPKGIEEVREKVSVYLATHIGQLTPNIMIDVNKPIGDSSKNDTPILIAPEYVDADLVRWQNLIELLASEINRGKLHPHAVLGAQSISDLIKIDSSSIDKMRLERYCNVVENALNKQTISEELEELFAGFSSKQISILFCRTSPWKKTLEAIGHKRNLTRERVRQIEEKVRIRINEKLLGKHYIRLQSALLFAHDNGIKITHLNWVKSLIGSELLGTWGSQSAANILKEFKPEDLLIAVSSNVEDLPAYNRFRLPENLRTAITVKRSGISAEAQMLLASIPKKSLRFIHNEVRNGGAVHVPTVAKRLSISEESVCKILSTLNFERATQDWYLIRIRRKPKILGQQWAAFHVVLKMLKYCGPLDIKEIWRGVRSHVSRRGYVVPPTSVLLQTLISYGFDLQDGKVIWKLHNPSSASKSEKIVLEEIHRIGPVVSFSDLSQAFLNADLSIPALSNVLSHSPLVAKIETGLYKLRGSDVEQVDIHRAYERQPYTVANPEIRFEPSGIVRFSLNLGNLAITSGVIYSSHVPNLAGDWSVQVGDIPCGNVRVRDRQLWGMSKLFRTIKAQVGDRIEFGFDTWKHTVTVTKVQDESQ